MNPSTEAFIDSEGYLSGFTALICEWLTELFEIPFMPGLFEWDELMTGLESGKIDFTGELTPTAERLLTYFMTDPIAGRSVKYMRLIGTPDLAGVAESRLPRCAFLRDTVTYENVRAHLGETVEYIFVDGYEEVYSMMINNEVDFFFDDSTVEAAFDIYGDVIAEDFYPLIYAPVSLTTLNPDNKVIIDIVQKALQHDGLRHLTELYNLGMNQYRQHKFISSLTEEERAYIRDNPVITLAAEYDNYPASFYNAREAQWQGICFDVLAEVEALSGLVFELKSDDHMVWADLLDMLETGEASIISELIRTPEREGRFLWPETPLFIDYYALLSKSEHYKININEVWLYSVGVVEDTAHAELFAQWFYNHSNTVVYSNFAHAFTDLQRGEVDMVMASRNQLLMLTHYEELAGYKTNIVFNYPLVSTLGFNINEYVLCSIVDKAMMLIDTTGIADDWLSRTYDYRQQIAEMRQPWFIGSIIMLLSLVSVLIIVVILIHRGRQTERIAMGAKIREQELLSKNEMLDRLNSMKIEFFQNMNHDFKTPLTVISASVLDAVDMLDFEINKEEMYDTLNDAQSEIMRMSRMVDSAVKQASMYDSRQDMEPIDIAPLLRESADTHRVLVERHGNALTIDVPQSLPLTTANTDMLLLVLSNLFTNANRHTRNGEISIRAGEKSGSVNVSVKDSGTGIKPEMLPHVFKRGISDSGSGLGLSICQTAIEAHGGKISVKSEYGFGTEVVFVLPITTKLDMEEQRDE